MMLVRHYGVCNYSFCWVAFSFPLSFTFSSLPGLAAASSALNIPSSRRMLQRPLIFLSFPLGAHTGAYITAFATLHLHSRVGVQRLVHLGVSLLGCALHLQALEKCAYSWRFPSSEIGGFFPGCACTCIRPFTFIMDRRYY
jgi:hypothetical protein